MIVTIEIQEFLQIQDYFKFKIIRNSIRNSRLLQSKTNNMN